MKLIALALLLISCAADPAGPADPGNPTAPDAAPPADSAPPTAVDPHEQTTMCDPEWAVNGVLPDMCDVGCRIRPLHPVGSATSCQDPSRPCYLGAGCVEARKPVGSITVTCDETFTLSGHTGCCVQRPLATTPVRYVPTFYECPPPPR